MSQTQRLFIAGLVIAMLGLQFRVVDRFILSERATTVLNRHFPTSAAAVDAVAANSYLLSDLGSTTTNDRRSIEPPDWLGWSLLSVGAVLILACPVVRV